MIGYTRMTDGRRDGRTGDSIYALYSIYAVARKKGDISLLQYVDIRPRLYSVVFELFR